MSAVRADPPQRQRLAASDIDAPESLGRRRLVLRLLAAIAVMAVAAAVIGLIPGLGSLRARLARADPWWLGVGVALKLLSGLGYVAAFRAVFCRRMSWRVSTEVGMSELGANALLPTGGAGGLALGAWALRRGGMSASEIGRRTVAFFLLTSVPNVLAVIIIGLLLASGAVSGESNLALTLAPAAAATLAVGAALLAGRYAGRLQGRLERSDGAPATRGGRLVRHVLAAISNGVDEALVLLRERNGTLIAGLAAYLACDVMILWVGFRAFGSSPSIAIVWMAYLIGELGGLVPLPGGIGGVDVGLAGMLVLYGVRLTPATAAVIVYRAIALWVPAVAGALAFVALRRTLRNEAHRIAVCAPGADVPVIGLGTVVIDKPAPAAALRPATPACR